MVSKKKLDFGSNGYRPPIIPRAPRSTRRRGPLKKFPEDSQLSAFELLASVAGQLLHESESSASSNIADGKVKIPLGINENEEGKTVKSESGAYDNGSCAESSLLPEGSVEDHSLPESSVHENSGRADCDMKIGVCEYKNVDEDNMKVEDSNGDCENTNLLFNPDSSVKLPFHSDPIPNILVQKRLNSVKLGIRDDDEKSFRCNKLSTKIRAFRPQSKIGHRTRKNLASKYWKIARKVQDYELYNTSEGMNSLYRYRKSVYARAPIKKRKLFDQTSNDSTVKLSIKSIRVPEIYVEVPESATVGSLKRSVMEALSAIVGGGLRVGLVLQGKKVRDNKRTLQQAGICQNNNLENLGFTLEPSFSHISTSTTHKNFPLVLPCEAGQELPRPPDTPMIDSVISNVSTDAPLVDDYANNNNNIILSQEAPTDASNDEKVPDSKALIPAPPMNVEALSVTPLNSKNKCNELSQRRMRRPFSVAEVEALVESVEILGTGRWRDVKMRAFEYVDHRTYVDLKDKWKTLVHTGSISPQQRRGEPVPQHLLDRVLSAHSYWSQHQLKILEKHQVEPLKIVDAGAEIVGS